MAVFAELTTDVPAFAGFANAEDSVCAFPETLLDELTDGLKLPSCASARFIPPLPAATAKKMKIAGVNCCLFIVASEVFLPLKKSADYAVGALNSI